MSTNMPITIEAQAKTQVQCSLEDLLKLIDVVKTLPTNFVDEPTVCKAVAWAFVDCSGSTIRNDQFECFERLLELVGTRLFYYDDRVHTVKPKFRGGTNYQAIETFLKEKASPYPDVVIVLTDGCGTRVKPLYPDRWNWFIFGDCENFEPYLCGSPHLYMVKSKQ